MKLKRLTLVSYGRFADRTVEFAVDRPLTLVYGPNESGKSTLRTAITEFLYGIAKNTPYAYAGPPKLSGVLVAADDTELAFDRRANMADPSVPGDTKPWPEGTTSLMALLRATSRDAFCRLHCLDATALRAGAELLISPDSSLGNQLFAVGTGLGDLHQLEKVLTERLAELGDPTGRASAKKPYFVAQNAWETARRALANANTSAATLNAKRDEIRVAEAERTTARDQASEIARKRDGLQLILAVRPHLRTLVETAAALDALGEGSELPEGLATTVAALEEGLARKRETARQLDEQRRLAAERLANTGERAAILDQGAAIDELVDAAGPYAEREGDLAKQEVEARNARARAVETLDRIGLSDDLEAAAARRPNPLDREAAAAAVTALREAFRTETEAAKAKARVEAELMRARDRRAALKAPPDTAAAEQALTRETELLTASRTCSQAKAAAEDAQKAVDAVPPLGRLKGPSDLVDSLVLPETAAIEGCRQEFKALDKELRDAEHNLIDAEADLEKAEAERNRLAVMVAGIGWDKVDEARTRRDAVLDQAIAALAGAGTAPQAGEIRAAVAEVDRLLEQTAREAARVEAHLTAVNATERARIEVQAIRDRIDQLKQQAADLNQEWEAQFPAEVEVGSVDQMRQWVEQARVLKAGRLEAAKRMESLSRAQDDLDEVLSNVRAAAAGIGIETKGVDSRSLVLNLRRTVDDAKKGVGARKEAERKIDELEAALAEAEAERMLAATATEAARGRLAAALELLALPADSAPEIVDHAVRAWRDFDTEIGKLAEANRRIDGMKQRNAEAEKRLTDVRAALGCPEEFQGPFNTAVAVMKAVLEAARKTETERAERQRVDEQAEKDAATAAADRDREAALRAKICATHKIAEDADLLALAKASDERRRLRARRAEALESLAALAPGCAPEDLDSAAAQAPDDADIRRRLADLSDAVAGQEHAAADASTRIGRLEAELKALDDRTGAAEQADKMRQAAFEGMEHLREIARLKAALSLLRALVEGYRERNAHPLLQRAGRQLATVACGGQAENPIVDLTYDLREGGRYRLIALRRNEPRELQREEMSEGTADQMFLALRLAAIEMAGNVGEPLPFVGDDLLATSDDNRSEAILRTLLELPDRQQAILFTHHAAVRDMAAKIGKDRVSIVELNREALFA